jgi:predicted nucleic acid-binding protein
VPSRGESLVPQAEELLAAYGRREVGFVVPDLFWVELGNALWKLTRKAKIAPTQAGTALSTVRDLGIPTVPTFPLLPQALQIAMTHDRTVYDSLYVALARTSGSELITADERLANAIAAYFPVKWLGAL